MGTVRGEKHVFAKNSEARVRELKVRALKGEPNRILAQEYNLSPSSVSHIKTGATWAHVVVEDIPCTRNPRRGSEHWTAKLTEDKVREIRGLLEARVPIIDIAPRYGVSACTISNIKSGRIWKHVK